MFTTSEESAARSADVSINPQKNLVSIAIKMRSFTCSLNITFSSKFSQFCQIEMFTFQKMTKKKQKRFHSAAKKLKRMTFSWQSSHFCQITILNFVFWSFLTLNYLDSFWKKFGNSAKELLSIAWNSEKFHFFLEYHIFSSIFSIPSNCITKLQKEMQNTRKEYHLGATKTEKINIFFEHHIFFTIFCLLSDCITKVCFLLFFDTKLPWWFCKKSRKTTKTFSLSCKKYRKVFFLGTSHFLLNFVSFVKLYY